jgi:hypothetical protein
MPRAAVRRPREGEGCWLDASVQTTVRKDDACDNRKVGLIPPRRRVLIAGDNAS